MDDYTKQYQQLISQYKPTPEKDRNQVATEVIGELEMLKKDLEKNINNPAMKINRDQIQKKIDTYSKTIDLLTSMISPDEEEETLKESTKKGKKDACYRKAKAKYDVFPSAYASGYIAKCRKAKGKIK